MFVSIVQNLNLISNLNRSKITFMSLQKLKDKACKLSESDRLELVRAIIESLQNQPSQQSEKTRIIKQMKGLLKTNQPAPTDEQVKAMLAEHREEKYL
jgi:secreted Zn-dependent insulinase-like peptidase